MQRFSSLEKSIRLEKGKWKGRRGWPIAMDGLNYSNNWEIVLKVLIVDRFSQKISTYELILTWWHLIIIKSLARQLMPNMIWACSISQLPFFQATVNSFKCVALFKNPVEYFTCLLLFFFQLYFILQKDVSFFPKLDIPVFNPCIMILSMDFAFLTTPTPVHSWVIYYGLKSFFLVTYRQLRPD